jgi:Effector-associated domain 8
MVKLDPSTINKFVEILRPFVESEKERQSFLIAALGNDAPALQHISWGGSVATFIPHMLSKLADFGGREAFCAVLEYARSQMSVHENIQQRIDKLIRQLNLPALEMQTKVDSFILLMKQKVDAIVAADEKLQKILAWANQKSTLVDKICKSAAIRAFYLSIEVQNSFDDHLSRLIIPSFNPGISRSLQVDHLLYRCVFHSRSPDFSRPLYTSGSSSSFCMSITCITTTYLDFEMFLGELLKDSLNLQPKLKEALIKLKNKLPNGQERIKYQQFWNKHSTAWIEELVININSYCQICQDWQLNNEEKELFKQYYNANNLLVYCLNRVIAMSDDVRQEIEETLFLPIAEIEKRKH